MSRVFVVGDIHGACRALRQCFERSRFNVSEDYLISLGDVADGWPETKESVDLLMSVKNLTYILGNHDWWTLEWMRSGDVPDSWYSQGGKATIDSYREGIPPEHVRFFTDAKLYLERDNKLFVHAGFDPSRPVDEQDEDTFLWDRSLAMVALQHHGKSSDRRISTYDEVYVGHTPIKSDKPIESLGVWLMDTGAGWSGRLSMMDVDSKMIFTSDPVPQLYPGVAGRSRN